MIPDFDAGGNLPPGIHPASWRAILERFGWNACRLDLITRAHPALHAFAAAGCRSLWLAGTFVTAKDCPGDIDVLWDRRGVARLSNWDALLRDPEPRARLAQKAKFGAEFIAVDTPRTGLPYLEFFQTVKETDAPRGIVLLDPRSIPRA